MEAVDSDNNIGHDSSEPFQIKNHDYPVENNPPDASLITWKAVGKGDKEYDSKNKISYLSSICQTKNFVLKSPER